MEVNRLNQVQRSVQAQIAPPTGKYGQHQLHTIWKPISKKGALTLAEKLHIIDVMQKKGWNQPQTTKYFNTIEGYKGWVESAKEIMKTQCTSSNSVVVIT